MAITQVTYTGNGSTTLYSFSFPYLENSDIKVELNDVLQTITTHYTFANATTIQFNTAPTNGAEIRIYRDTDIDTKKADFYPGSSIRAQNLNDNFDQNLYHLQEVGNFALDKNGDTMLGNLNMGNNKVINLAAPTTGGDATNKTYVDTQDALKVSKAGDTMTGNLAMSGNKVTGLGTPTAGTDATTKAYVDGYINTAYLGPQASDPTTRPGGSPLQEGDLYFNTTEDILKAWTGSQWVISAAAGNIVRWRKTAVGGETSLSGNDDNAQPLSYVVGNEQVFINGALQTRGIDYTAGTGNSINGLVALTAGDVVELHAVQGYVSATITPGSINDALVAPDAGIQASKLSFTQAGTGATARTVDSKLKDVVSVKDFGAVGDGVADDTAAIQAALDATQAISFPAGAYKVTSTLLIKNHNKVVYGNNSVIAYTGTGWVINAQLVGGTVFPQYLQLNDLYIASGPNATGGIYWRFSYGTAKNISVQIPATNQIGWQIGCHSGGTGAYYNQFQNCNVQGYVGITAGVANQKGWLFEVVAVSGIAPNTNTFVGGRTSQTKIAWSISGLNNRLIGPTVEGTESGGTCFVIANAIQPLACGYNHITSPYVEGLAGANVFSIVSGYYNAIVYPFVTSTGGGTVFSDTAVGTTLLNESGYRFPNYRSSDSQTLDAYKEGTWTPSLFALGGGTASYAYAGGTYTQIGNRILFDGYIGLSSVGTLSGAVKLVLPFQASSANIFSTIAFARTSAISGGYPVLGGEINASATRADLILSSVTGSGTGVLQASQLANNSEFSFSGHYII